MDIIGNTYDKILSDESNQAMLNIDFLELAGELDETENWNIDDFGNTVYDSDWVFTASFDLTSRTETVVATQDGFLTALDEFHPDTLIKNKLEIISGRQWLAARAEEFGI